MDNLYLALKFLSVSLLVIICFRAAHKTFPTAFKKFRSGNSFLALVYILPVIVLIVLTVFVIVSGFGY